MDEWTYGTVLRRRYGEFAGYTVMWLREDADQPDEISDVLFLASGTLDLGIRMSIWNDDWEAVE